MSPPILPPAPLAAPEIRSVVGAALTERSTSRVTPVAIPDPARAKPATPSPPVAPPHHSVRQFLLWANLRQPRFGERCRCGLAEVGAERSPRYGLRQPRHVDERIERIRNDAGQVCGSLCHAPDADRQVLARGSRLRGRELRTGRQ
jgi:hypothetical protein